MKSEQGFDRHEKMKILSFMGDGYVLPHTLKDIQQSLWRLGHSVQVLDMRKMDRYHRLVAFADKLVYYRPHLLFTIDTVGLLPQLAGVLKRPPEVLTWFYDNPLRILSDSFLCINRHLHIFLWDEAYVDSVKERGFMHVHYQPFATNQEVYRVIPDVEKIYDVSFVGSYSPARAKNLQALARQDITVHVFGNAEWEMIADERLVYEGTAHNRKDCPRIYNASRINLNITSEQLLTALPVRIYDAMACGGFVLTDNRRDAACLFHEGEEIAVYQNPEDMVDKIRYYLSHPEERIRIAEAGKRKVLSSYTFDSVIPSMLEGFGESASGDNTSGSSEYDIGDYARAAWIVGMSCVKFGDYEEGARLLLAVMDICPRAEIVYVALAVLAARVGERPQLDRFIRNLTDLGSEWVSRKHAFYALMDGDDFPYWDMIYEQYFGLKGNQSAESVL